MDYNQHQTPPPYWGENQVSVTSQVNSVMRKVYVRMFIGLLISAFCALGVASTPSVAVAIFSNKIVYWGLLIGMLVMAWVIPSRLTRMKQGTVLLWFCVFSAVMGCFLAPLFYVYRLGTITYTLFITAGTFGAMSVYGYFTKSDLSKFGTYLMMALFGLIILSIVNIFVHSSTFEWVVSIVGVLVFVGLTAWDTQQVRRLAQSNLDPAMADKLATMGAMNLYLDFINLFLYLLRIFGASDRS